MVENPMVVGPYYRERDMGRNLSDYLPFEFELPDVGPKAYSMIVAIEDGKVVSMRIENGNWIERGPVLDWWLAELSERFILAKAYLHATSSNLTTYQEC